MLNEFSSSVTCFGEFAQRLNLLWSRLHESDHYTPDKVFHPADYAWPGDTEGRILLAWVLCGKVLERNSPYLAEYWHNFKAKLNPDGYFGKIYLPELIDEQQLSGHGWLLRGLSELYRVTGDKEVAEIGKKILNNLIRPLAGRYSSYPVTEAARNAAGGASGSRDRQIGDWWLSTDIGCAFILTDGVVQAAKTFGIDCSDVLDEMFECFAKVDLLKVAAQTHATLTMTRAALRSYAYTGNHKLLQLAQKNYDLYRAYGMTEHYANDNWFGRPEWTEPCAIVDSFQCAMQLARICDRPDYLDDAHRIWFSAILHAQRNNGGFGLESCPHGDGNHVLQAVNPEAYWCCTMRGAEAFYECALRNVERRGNVVRIALPIPGIFRFEDGLTIEVKTDYPKAMSGTADIVNEGKEMVERVEFFFVNQGWCEGQSGADYPLQERLCKYGKGKTFWFGPVLTGVDEHGNRSKLGESWRSLSLQPELKLKVVESD